LNDSDHRFLSGYRLGQASRRRGRFCIVLFAEIFHQFRISPQLVFIDLIADRLLGRSFRTI